MLSANTYLVKRKGWAPTASTTRHFRSRNLYVWSVWELSQLEQKVQGRILCFHALFQLQSQMCRCVTNSEQFGVLAPTSRYPPVAQCLVMDATFGTICLIVPISFLVLLATGCLGLMFGCSLLFHCLAGFSVSLLL